MPPIAKHGSAHNVTAGHNLVEQAMRQLEARILDGSWRPGMRLPAERVLAEQFGVSRGTVREALQRLVARGLLASRPGSGIFVTDRLQTGFVSPWRQLIADHPEIRGDMLEFRRVIESAAIALAALRVNDDDLEKLAGIVERLKLAHREGNRTAEAKADADFHEAIAEATHNTMFRHLHAGVITMLREHIALNIDQMRTDSAVVAATLLEQHLELYEAIRRRDPVHAGATMCRHIDFVRDRLALERADAMPAPANAPALPDSM
jgi:GntR family transcriptional repressor for pyruvate dehydrogenase complex